jgi:iron complex outermembrane recepter protein
MRKSRMVLAVASAFPLALACAAPALAQATDGAPVKELGVVTITGGQPTSLPTQIPTTIEGVTREQIEHSINATDSEDALK